MGFGRRCGAQGWGWCRVVPADGAHRGLGAYVSRARPLGWPLSGAGSQASSLQPVQKPILTLPAADEVARGVGVRLCF